MKQPITLGTVLLAGALVVLPGLANARALSTTDQKFVMGAAYGGMAEVKLGQLAAEQGASNEVKQFGQKMVDDHGKANDDLKSVAGSKKLSLPTGLDPKDQALYDRLSKLHGAAFDRAYIKAMQTDHAKDIAAFKKEAGNGHDSDIKLFVSRTLPVIEEHYRMISSIASGQTKMHRSSKM